jgi:hypothetical protein
LILKNILADSTDLSRLNFEIYINFFGAIRSALSAKSARENIAIIKNKSFNRIRFSKILLPTACKD